MAKFFIVLKTRAAGVPYNIRVETTADTQALAENNALYLLRKYGHDVFNVNAKTFAPHLKAFMATVKSNRELAVTHVEENGDEWVKAINIRAYTKTGEHA